MDIIGNNISNVNTVGYKAGRAVFQDLLSQTLVGGKAPTDARGGVNPRQVGLGSYLAAVDTMFETGTMQTTAKNSDLAIQGEGFFVLRGETENEYLYTRAGDFNFDRSGALTNPGGFNVQGWMVDPVTGELATDGQVSDIVLGSEYQTVQAQATTEVGLSGVLNSQADPTIVEYPTLLHYADPANELTSVYSSKGAKMDMADNEPIKIKAHGTGMTDMKYIYNSSDVNLNLENDQTVLMYVNSTAYTFTYGTDFSSMSDLAAAVETQLDSVAGAAGQFNVSIQNGTFNINRVADNGTNVSLDSFSGSPHIAVSLSNLSGTYDDVGDTKSSDELYFESQIYAGRDFNTLTDLGVKIEQTLDGNVIGANQFSVSYDNTDGTFSYDIDASASATDITLTGFSLDKAYSGTVFENNIIPAGSSNIIATAGGTATAKSDAFLRTAKDDDPMTELFTSSGDSLGLDATAIVQISASVDGESVPGTGTIPAVGSTLNDFRKAVADYFGYDSSSEAELSQHIGSFDENGGKLQITGEKGSPNEIDFVKFEVVGGGSYDKFYDYYEYQTVQSAKGGEMVTSQTIYDSQGEAHTLQYNFTMDDANDNVWKLQVSSPDTGTSLTFNETTGDEVYINFNSNGSFNYISTPNGQRVAELTLNFDPGNGAGVITDIEMGLGTASKFDGLYVSADEGSVSRSEQDGYPTGSLEKTLFNPAGEIIGYYTNGQVKTIAQIALGIFTNPQGLLKVGDTTFQATANSGDAAIGKPQTSFRGDIASGALENSNVDMSSSFVNMITTQRGFQANSRVITTSDEMLQELMTLKR
jgi:flagellar hook protein FlgE